MGRGGGVGWGMQRTDGASVGERTKGYGMEGWRGQDKPGCRKEEGTFKWDFEGQTKFNQRENVGLEKGMKI